jgi:hypothetical protein
LSTKLRPVENVSSMMGARMKISRFFAASLAALGIAAVGGCSSLPDVTVSYFPAKATTTLAVTQSIDCDAQKQHLFFVYSVVPTTVYSSDLSQAPHTLHIRDLDGTFSDVATTFNLTDDGRLKSINASTTGEAEAIVKAAASLVTTLGALAAAAPAASPPCDVVTAWGGGKPVSLTYTQVLNYGNAFSGGTYSLAPAPGNEDLYRQLKDHLPSIALYADPPKIVPRAASGPSATTGDVLLALNDTASTALTVKVHDAIDGDVAIWNGVATIPEGSIYYLPIPKSALFGKQVFTLSLSDAGAITSVGYEKDNGAAGVLNSVNSAAGAEKPTTAADEAAQLKAQADIIAQQARLVRCNAQPSACT